MKNMYKTLLSAVLVLVATNAFSQSDGVLGTWQTESSDKGYIHVVIEECGDALCGKIVNAFNLDDEIMPDYEHVGNQVKTKPINPKCHSMVTHSVFLVACLLFVAAKIGPGLNNFFQCCLPLTYFCISTKKVSMWQTYLLIL